GLDLGASLNLITRAAALPVTLATSALIVDRRYALIAARRSALISARRHDLGARSVLPVRSTAPGTTRRVIRRSHRTLEAIGLARVGQLERRMGAALGSNLIAGRTCSSLAANGDMTSA